MYFYKMGKNTGMAKNVNTAATETNKTQVNCRKLELTKGKQNVIFSYLPVLIKYLSMISLVAIPT